MEKSGLHTFTYIYIRVLISLLSHLIRAIFPRPKLSLAGSPLLYNWLFLRPSKPRFLAQPPSTSSQRSNPTLCDHDFSSRPFLYICNTSLYLIITSREQDHENGGTQKPPYHGHPRDPWLGCGDSESPRWHG
jgi:hypothetical protein